MRVLSPLFYLILLSLSFTLPECNLIGTGALSHIKKVSNIPFPTGLKTLSEFDNFENRQGGKYQLKKEDVQPFLQKNPFIPLDQNYALCSHFNLFSKVDPIPLEDTASLRYFTGCGNSNAWIFTINIQTGELWIENEYPDFSGEAPPCAADQVVTASPPRYQLVKDWPHLPKGFLLGNPSGIGIDNNQHIFVFHRASKKWPVLFPFSTSLIKEPTITELDKDSGKIINSWGANIFIMPHSLTVDKENNIWVTDVGLQQVLKFTHDGRLLMRIGELGVAGNDSTHFDRPTDIAIAADGSFYVSDGYRNSRVVHFSPSGHYLSSWGSKGDGPGQFNIPHSIDLDSSGNVYVADRENSRIQVFNPQGHFLKEWKQDSFGKMYALRFDAAKRTLIAADYITNYITPKGSDIILFTLDGQTPTRFGRTGGNYTGPVCRYHDLTVDKEGNIYVGDILEDRIQKFRRLPD